MCVIPFKDRKSEYKSSNKDMLTGFSVTLGKPESRRPHCDLLLKCYHQFSVSLFFFVSYIVISSTFLSVS